VATWRLYGRNFGRLTPKTAHGCFVIRRELHFRALQLPGSGEAGSAVLRDGVGMPHDKAQGGHSTMGRIERAAAALSGIFFLASGGRPSPCRASDKPARLILPMHALEFALPRHRRLVGRAVAYARPSLLDPASASQRVGTSGNGRVDGHEILISCEQSQPRFVVVERVTARDVLGVPLAYPTG